MVPVLRDPTRNAVDFDTTFDEEYPPLVRYCRRLSGDRDAAEDVAQEAMVRLFEREVRGAPPESEHGSSRPRRT